jgi:outer membrane protein assembly factor BamB
MSGVGALKIRGNLYQSNVNIMGLEKSIVDDGLMDSPWPMYCHDTRHTGRSPYGTADNIGFEKWRYEIYSPVLGSPVIDEDDIIYIGSDSVYSIFPNGTLNWRYEERFRVDSAPTIDENGVLYVGSIWAHPNYLYAIYTSNGTLKWKYQTGDDVYSSPAIGNDGTIYFCDSGNWQIKALYPNGTLKWSFQTNHVVHSSPAISIDGIIYCGSHDGNLYAIYPNNGTLKWKYQTGDWVARGPCISDDGTIYFGSWDGYLYAVYPNGSLKWKTGGYLAGTTPVIAQDGTIYVGNRYLSAIYPINGSVKWTFDPGPDRLITSGNPCISAEGTIYFGTDDGGEIIAVNPNGTERWRRDVGTCRSAPVISEDGTVYVGGGGDDGHLFAFGSPNPNAPVTPTINGPIKGDIGTSYDYTFTSTDPNGDDIFYYISWGDGTSDGWLGPYGSGEDVKVSHTWSKSGTYMIQAQAKDTNDLKSDWGKLTITMPKNKESSQQFSNQLILKMREQLLYKSSLLEK